MRYTHPEVLYFKQQDLMNPTPIADEFISSQISLLGKHNSIFVTVEYDDEEHETRRVASALINIEKDGKSLLFKKFFSGQVCIQLLLLYQN